MPTYDELKKKIKQLLQEKYTFDEAFDEAFDEEFDEEFDVFKELEKYEKLIHDNDRIIKLKQELERQIREEEKQEQRKSKDLRPINLGYLINRIRQILS